MRDLKEKNRRRTRAHQRLPVQQHEHLARVDALDLLAGGAGAF